METQAPASLLNANSLSSLPKIFSLEDLSSAYLSMQGLNRTDSEAAFQEFLKRIPSSTNLSTLPSSTNLLHGADNILGPGALAAAGKDASAGAPNAAGMARVSSLEFLARFVGAPPPPAASFPPAPAVPPATTAAASTTSSGYVKPEPGLGAIGTGPFSIGGLPSDFLANPLVANALSGLTALPGGLPGVLAPSAALAPPPPAPSNHISPSSNAVHAAAAALQLHGQLSKSLGGAKPSGNGARHSQGTSASATSQSDGDEPNAKVEVRRQRRMLSNRESARRSRKRKQEHLSKLEGELAEINEQKRVVQERLSSLERKFNSVEEENRRMKEENERLRDELRYLRSELSHRSKERSWHTEADDVENHHPPAPAPPPPSKRARQQQDNGYHADHEDGHAAGNGAAANGRAKEAGGRCAPGGRSGGRMKASHADAVPTA